MLYAHATIITVDVARNIILDGAILVRDTVIADIDKTDVLLAKYPSEQVTSLESRIIIPGLINTHMHVAQTLLRGNYYSAIAIPTVCSIQDRSFDCEPGTADDLELVSWLCERIWVLQGNFTAEDGYAAARLSIAEMLKSGTTCFLESMVRTLTFSTYLR